jgi:hypothetical protein
MEKDAGRQDRLAALAALLVVERPRMRPTTTASQHLRERREPENLSVAMGSATNDSRLSPYRNPRRLLLRAFPAETLVWLMGRAGVIAPGGPLEVILLEAPRPSLSVLLGGNALAATW